MATFKAKLRTEKRQDNTHMVLIVITKDRETRRYTTHITLKKTDWNPKADNEKKNWVRTSHHEHAQLNAAIKNMLREFQAIDIHNPTFNAQQIRDAYGHQDDKKGTGFIAFAREWIRRKDDLGQHGTATVYESALFYFTRFWGTRPDTAEQLTPGMISKLVHHMRTVDVSKAQKGYEASTINLAFKNYRTIFKNAVLEGWLPPMPNPFDIPLQAQEDKPIEYPTVKELLGLMEVEGLTPVMTHARNVLLMQYFLNGARVQEVLLLERKALKQERVDYQPKKRSKRVKSITRHEGMEWILRQYPEAGKYIFPYFTEADEQLSGKEKVRLMQRLVTTINGALRRLAKRAGLQVKLTTHVQRHAFAERVWELTKDLRKVQEMVGHESAQTTEGYLERLHLQDRDELNDSIYSGIKIPGQQ
jgi:site-specific recombinase XerD